MTRAFLAIVLALAAWGLVAAAEPEAPPAAPGSERAALDAVREQLVALEIEKALAALGAILDAPGLSEADRVDALDLRAQAHAASDDLDGVAKDYRQILELRAGYAPNPEVTSKKALERFAKTRAAMIGTVHLDVDPKDASLAVDDRAVTPLPDGSFPTLAGERRLTLTRKGFDPMDTTVHAVAGGDVLVKIALVPNARTVVARTDVPGVAVTVDGTLRGETARPPGDASGADVPATLTLDDVAIGEHELVFSKPCFATETTQQIVSVDLADRAPKVLQVVAMRPARTRVTVSGAQYEGELRVDGARVASLPLASFSMCPGHRSVEVLAGRRVVWSGAFEAEEAELALDLAPRPNVVLFGARWPREWEEVAAAWSERERRELPAGVDLTTREGWGGVTLPAGTDLAVAVVPGAAFVGGSRVVLFSPALRDVEEPSAPPKSRMRSWVAGSLGAVAVDGPEGTVVLASVAPDGPAAKAGLQPGDRIVSIAGRAVKRAPEAREAIASLHDRQNVALEIASPGSEPRRVECAAAAMPLLERPRDPGASRVVDAAWATVDAAAGPVAAALANLAVLLDHAGQTAAASDAWRRAGANSRGALAARASYAIAAGLQADGKRAEAIEAFGRARDEARLAGDPVIAAAAMDRLADLGVAGR